MLVIPQYIMPSNVFAPSKEAWIGWDLSFKEQKISKWCFETFSSASLFGYLLVGYKLWNIVVGSFVGDGTVVIQCEVLIEV